MNFGEKFRELIETQQAKFPDWVVQDHGAGGHIEMMKNVIAKDGSEVMVFIWNDESVTIMRHPYNMEKFMTVEQWNDPMLNGFAWENQGDCFEGIIHREENQIKVYSLAEQVFSRKTSDELADILFRVGRIHKVWDDKYSV